MHHCLFRGTDALSPFRLERLRSAAIERAPDITRLEARHVYFAQLPATPTPHTESALERLLDACAAAPDTGGGDAWTLPRPGTITPWSSKATDIARLAGLAHVERLEAGIEWRLESGGDAPVAPRVAALLYDRMTQRFTTDADAWRDLFAESLPARLTRVPLIGEGRDALVAFDRAMGLALSASEIDYLVTRFGALGRDPSDVEIMMFAQANSEHCRHKIFNTRWTIDGRPRNQSLFRMIRFTHESSPGRVTSAYVDNAAVIEGHGGTQFAPDPGTGVYRTTATPLDIVMKVETHNHPTAIAPYPGAATGTGGEIRDEAATGRGARSKAGLVGFSVSNLRIPGFEQPWERDHGRPGRIASALEIMRDGPLGAAGYGNEFGRPALLGYFRTLEWAPPGAPPGVVRGYHKPIMLAGGFGNIRRELTEKRPLPPGTPIVVLGGPAMLIGLGGGAASSMSSGQSDAELDFASVQRENPEMQRRCQEVIDRCSQLGEANPILSIHDVGAGGLSNAVPEIVHGAGLGADLDLRAIPSDDAGMSPLEIWCNESQERFVLAVQAERLEFFTALCERERCPQAVLGLTRAETRLTVRDSLLEEDAVDVPMDLILGAPPLDPRIAHRVATDEDEADFADVDCAQALERVLRMPAVADKTFLVTIGDRTVTGLVCRDQMVGRWQVPVADCAVTAGGYTALVGEAAAIGERAPVALADAPASGRLAVGEALTNLAAAAIDELGDVALSANWMAACGDGAEDAALYETVCAVGMELCPALGIAIPVGKDSLSMRSAWDAPDGPRVVSSPLSLVVTAFAPVRDVRACATPVLRAPGRGAEVASTLLYLDLGGGRNRLGGSALALAWERFGGPPPDLDDPAALVAFFRFVQALNREGRLLAYHDRSDGGLVVTALEMAFAGGCGLELDLDGPGGDPLALLFSEELGALVEVRDEDLDAILARARAEPRLAAHVHRVGRPARTGRARIRYQGRTVLDAPIGELRRTWSETSHRMQRLRDDPACADEAFERIGGDDDRGLTAELSFSPDEDVAAPWIRGARPAVAVLREQGVNGHVEMAAAFDRAGFDAVDVHMSDVLAGRVDLGAFRGLAGCGGFSYGDVLGAGGGWARTILDNPRARDAFAAFFARRDSFALGVCNGCQMMSHLTSMIPGAGHWPSFVANRSGRFEARLVNVEVPASPSIFLSGMAGSTLPVAIAHGEGRAVFGGAAELGAAQSSGTVALRYVEQPGVPANRYPANPNGSEGAVGGMTTADGRVTVLMPHPERLFRTVQFSWAPPEWGEDGPWLRMFRNARVWCAGA